MLQELRSIELRQGLQEPNVRDISSQLIGSLWRSMAKELYRTSICSQLSGRGLT